MLFTDDGAGQKGFVPRIAGDIATCLHNKKENREIKNPLREMIRSDLGDYVLANLPDLVGLDPGEGYNSISLPLYEGQIGAIIKVLGEDRNLGDALREIETITEKITAAFNSIPESVAKRLQNDSTYLSAGLCKLELGDIERVANVWDTFRTTGDIEEGNEFVLRYMRLRSISLAAAHLASGSPKYSSNIPIDYFGEMFMGEDQKCSEFRKHHGSPRTVSTQVFTALYEIGNTLQKDYVFKTGSVWVMISGHVPLFIMKDSSDGILDTEGNPMPADKMDRIFVDYRTNGTPETEGHKEMALRLRIARKIIADSGLSYTGQINVYSRNGENPTTFFNSRTGECTELTNRNLRKPGVGIEVYAGPCFM